MVYLMITVGIIAIVVFVYVTKKDQLGHIPGPKRRWFYGNTLDIDARRSRLAFHRWHKQYGPVIRVRLPVGDMVIVSGFEDLYDVLVTKGYAYAGRARYFRREFVMGVSGIVYRDADPIWKHFRKVIHGYLKQFGTGLDTLETYISEASDEMFETFQQYDALPFDPMDAINDATLYVLCRLIIGPTIGKSTGLFTDLKSLAAKIPPVVSSSAIDFRLLDLCPWLIMQFPLPVSRKVKQAREFIREIWSDIKSRQNGDTVSLVGRFLELITTEREAAPPFTDDALRTACMEILGAGQVTTIPTVYAIIQALAHVPDIQNTAFEEVQKVEGHHNEKISLKRKSEMPYVQAIILEALRCFTAVPTSIPHVTTKDTPLLSCGTIPRGTIVLPNLWSLHHDETFWGDPDVFRPERFLNADGQLLPASDSKRKHLMPFGAGPRVCVGEVFALCRLFMWTVGLVERFYILLPKDHAQQCEWMNPNIHLQDINLRPVPHQVIFKARK